MAAVKEHLSALSGPRREFENGMKLNVLDHLMVAHKAVAGMTVRSKGLLRELIGDDRTLALAIGGHRGMGENLLNDHEPLNLPNLWRENSIKSFLKAHQHGARFVEMDVQVTSDGVPVIWHDDEITFGSQFAPISRHISDLCHEEFKSLGPMKLRENEAMHELIPLHRRFRSRMHPQPDPPSQHTAWHCFDDDALPSLKDVLESLPLDLGLNLEIKMATPDTLAATPPLEIERMTQPIVDLLIKNSRVEDGRQIVVSSFDPDICTEIKRKLEEALLTTIPVMLLSEGGFSPHADPRRTSISTAIDFCMEHQLMGLVVNTSRLRCEPHQIDIAIRHGLKVMTYGLENDDITWLEEQWKLGVHGAIVDDVAEVVPRFVQHVQKFRKDDSAMAEIAESQMN